MIITPRLVLRLHNRQSETMLNEVRWLNNPEITKFSEQRHKRHTIDTQIEYLNALAPYDAFYQVWFGEQHIGGVTIFFDPYNLTADMGIMIGEMQGQGFGKEAWEGAMNALFKSNTRLRKVTAGCMAANAPMMAICRRTGMTQEALVPKHFYYNSRPCDLILFGKYNGS